MTWIPPLHLGSLISYQSSKRDSITRIVIKIEMEMEIKNKKIGINTGTDIHRMPRGKGPMKFNPVDVDYKLWVLWVVGVCMFMCVYVSVYVCLCTHIHIHTHSPTAMTSLISCSLRCL
ncbi:hypothetical protein BDF14DRAFT_927057 [Spinellus fusiger]|nr:hypothetical protein BDF14DRAFT_927057 [Spinellus fusiger]